MSLQLNTTLPDLFVSQSQLSFAPTEVGEERFLLVKIGRSDSDAPVRVVSEVAPFFQVAVQASPLRFGAEATFTPAPGGTFIHVRYAPRQAGRHVGQLTVEAGQETQTVVLSGRTIGLLARLSPPRRLAYAPPQLALPTPRSDAAVGSERATNRSVTAVAVTIGVISLGALAYWGTTHRNVASQPVPASVAPKMTPIPPGTDDSKPTRLVAKTPAAAKPRPIQPVVVPEKKQSGQTDLSQEPTEQTNEPPVAATERAEPVRPASPRPALAQTETPPTPRSVARPAAQRAVAEPTKKRLPKPAEPTSDESDLERALNKNQ